MGILGNRLFSFANSGDVKPLTSKEKKKRDTKNKIQKESRRKNRPVKKSSPVPKPRCIRSK